MADNKKKDDRTFGERVADRVASFGGSWTFIFIFAMILITWVTLNTLSVTKAIHWDEYPYILMNLFLSFIAAFQAPIIMMSQNRQAKKQDEDNRSMMMHLTQLVEQVVETTSKDLELDQTDRIDNEHLHGDIEEILSILKKDSKASE